MKRVNNLKILALILLIIIGGASFYFYKNYEDNSDDYKYPDYIKNIELNDSFFNSMDKKELIHYKILNSIDFFKNVEAEYVEYDKPSKLTTNVTCYADIKNNQSHTIKNNNSNIDMEIICKDNSKIEFNNIDKTYRSFDLTTNTDDNIKKLKPEDRYKGNDDSFIPRNDGNFLIGARSILLNQEVAAYLKDYKNWDIDKEEKYLNRNALYLKGKFGFTGKNDQNNFSIIVDKNTGIILDLSILDKNHEVISSIKMKNIKIDAGIDTKNFDKSTKGYSNKTQSSSKEDKDNK